MNEDKNSPQNPEKKSHNSIDKLQERLYSREENSSVLNEKSYGLGKKDLEVSGNWAKEPEFKPKMRSRHKTLVRKALIIASIFFVLAVSVSAFLIWRGFNLVSSDNIEIEVKGGTSIEAGKELSLDVSVVNNNRSGLRDITVTLEYPSGARDPKDIQKSLTRQQEKIESIASRKKETKTFKSILFGERNSVKEIIVSIEYKSEDSESVFTKEKVYEIGIRSSPVTLTVSGPKEINSGQELEFEIAINSNSSSIIENLMLIADYPLGFSFKDATPNADKGERVWNLGTLEPREKKEIIVRGVVDGRENEEKTFNFALGIKNENNDESLGIEFSSSRESVIIKEAFINLGVEINQSTADAYVAKDKTELKVSINWENSLPVDLNDVSVEVFLKGEILDELSVDPRDRGFYQSQTNKITWNKNTNSEFSRIGPRKKGLLEFSFKTLSPDSQSVGQFTNNEIGLEILMKGTRFSDSRNSEIVTALVKRFVKIETDLSLAARALYSVGPFSNSGPLPPQAENPTTYTIIWDISNNYNEVRDGVVSATLPVYVDWSGNFSPKNEKVSFDPDTRKVIWNVGNILPGTGYTGSPKELAFQISLNPSLGQVGTSPDLLNDSEIIGSDNFTNTNVRQQKPSLSTRIVSDPVFDIGKDKVVR